MVLLGFFGLPHEATGRYITVLHFSLSLSLSRSLSCGYVKKIDGTIFMHVGSKLEPAIKK
jgi:hypothetical protein